MGHFVRLIDTGICIIQHQGGGVHARERWHGTQIDNDEEQMPKETAERLS